MIYYWRHEHVCCFIYRLLSYPIRPT
jgi:hypothetical protein